MLLLGLTGGIAMGKTTTAALFVRRGVRVVDTDLLARELVEPGQPALAEIVAEFGKGVLNSHGRLNRSELARIVFSDDRALAKLEEILHPRIENAWLAQVGAWELQGVKVGMVVIPLLFETDAAKHFQSIICVACSEVSQRERMLARGWTPGECAQRIKAQWPIARKMELSDYVIWSEGGEEIADAQVELILRELGARFGVEELSR